MDDSEGNPEEKHEVQASEFRSAKLPTFWKNEPKLWFAMLEREFAAYGVKNDAVKCTAVIRHLDTTTMKTVADIIAAPPAPNSYEQIKEALISRLATSEETQLRQLLTGIDIHDKKPSELLREMKFLAGKNVSTNALQTLWLQRLPTRVQEILAVVEGVELDKLAQLADKSMERSGLPEVATVVESKAASHDKEMAELTRRLTELETIVRTTARPFDKRRQRYTRQRSRSRSRSKGGFLHWNEFLNIMEHHYLDSDDENNGRSSRRRRRQVAPEISTPTPLMAPGLGTVNIPAQYFIDKLNAIDMKLDSLSSRMSVMEHKTQSIHEGVLDLRRSLPRYTTPVVTPQPTLDRRLQ